MSCLAIFCALLCSQQPSAPKAEGDAVSGTVSQLKLIQDLAQGNRTRFLDIQLEWRSGKEPILVSGNPSKVFFQAGNLPDKSNYAGSALVPTETGSRHVWSVALPGDWVPSEPWRCSVEGLSIIGDRFVVVSLGRIGALMDRLKQGPFEAAKDGLFRCLIKKAERRGSRISIAIRVEIDAHGVELESFQSWVSLNRLESKVGDQARGPLGYSIEGQDSSFAEVIYHLPAGLPLDAMLSYRALASMRKAPIRLDFKGIPPW